MEACFVFRVHAVAELPREIRGILREPTRRIVRLFGREIGTASQRAPHARRELLGFAPLSQGHVQREEWRANAVATGQR